MVSVIIHGDRGGGHLLHDVAHPGGLLTARLHNIWFRFTEPDGQGLVEYVLIIAIVALGTIAALTFLKGSITGLFSKAGSSIGGAG